MDIRSLEIYLLKLSWPLQIIDAERSEQEWRERKYHLKDLRKAKFNLFQFHILTGGITLLY